MITFHWHRQGVLSVLLGMAGPLSSGRKCNTSWKTADEIKVRFWHQIRQGVLFQDAYLFIKPCHCLLPHFVPAVQFVIGNIWGLFTTARTGQSAGGYSHVSVLWK